MSKLECLDPAVGDALLDAAHPAHTSLSPDQLRHIGACENCRVSVERTRRLVSAYREVLPSAAEIAAARVRYAGRTMRRHGYGAVRRWHLLPRAVTVALLLAAVASAAAQIAARRSERLKEAGQATLAAKHSHQRRAHGRRRLPGAPNAGSPIESDEQPDEQSDEQSDSNDQSNVTPAVEPTPTPTAIAMPAPLPAAESPPTGPVPTTEARRPDAPVVAPALGPAQAPAHLRKSPRRPPAAVEAGPAQTPREELTTASWQAAAAALRANDPVQAERALDALADATDLRTRDAARLARAQLWLSQRKVDRARADLQDLAATGVTAIIRESAREALLSIP